MNKLLLPVLLTLSCTIGFSATIDVFTDIANAIRSGEAKAITNFCGNTVNLTILNQEDVYSRAQAEQVLKSFFAKNTPRSFTIVHKGGSKEGSKYAIGTMVSSQGMKFRVYLLFKQTAGGETLQEIRFEKE